MTLSVSSIKKAGAVILACIATGFTANAQQVIGLQKAVDLTLQNNLTIKQAQINEAISDADYKQAKNNLLPSLTAAPNAGYNFGRNPVAGQYAYTYQTTFSVNGSTQLQLTLFQGGQLRNQILENKLALDANKTTTEKVKNDLLLNVVTDYLAILQDQDLVTAAKEQIALAKITVDRTQKNVDAGNQTVADLAQAQAQLSTAELNLTNDQNQEDLAILVLKQYMEMDPSTPITVEKPDLSKLTDIKTIYNQTEVIKTAFSTNPDIRLAELQQQTYAQAIKVAQGSLYPSMYLFGNLQSSYANIVKNKVIGQTEPAYVPIGTVQGTGQVVQSNTQQQFPIYSNSYPFYQQFGDNFNQSFGVSLQIPIFNKLQARTNIRKAKLNYQNAELATQLAKNTLSKTIIQALQDLASAEKSYLSSQQTFNSNKEALNITKQRYDAGLVNTLDYNTAVTNYDKSQNDLIEAQYQVVFRAKVIDYYMGNPIVL